MTAPGADHAWISALYDGEVFHRRHAPTIHDLRYRLFQLLIDLDELQPLARKLRWFSANGFNLFSFHERDHGDGGGDLKAYVLRTLAEHGLEGGGAVRVLCMPRLLGFVFNPITLYYCHAPDGRLSAMIYEVNNTFGDRHSYLIPVEIDAGEVVRQTCAKRLHVSPFMEMTMTYDFAITSPADAIHTIVRGLLPGGSPMITASFEGRREPLTDTTLLRMLIAHPLMTLKVIAAIHLEAGKLLLKGVRLCPDPGAPIAPISFTQGQRHGSVNQSA